LSFLELERDLQWPRAGQCEGSWFEPHEFEKPETNQTTLQSQVSEGLDVLEAIDDAFVDDNGRPLQVRISSVA